MLQLSTHTRLIIGIALITVPTIEFGGVALLKMIRTREPGYMDNPLRQNLFRAGHAHAGVILILSMICNVLVDAIALPDALAWFVRLGVPAAAILMPLGFFLSVASPRAERPNGLIALVYIGALVLAISVLILGVGLVRSTMYPAFGSPEARPRVVSERWSGTENARPASSNDRALFERERRN